MEGPRVRIGDVVRLNDAGLENIYGSKVGLTHMKTMELTITHVDSRSVTHPEPSYFVEVDNLEINQFLITDWCFDVVRSSK